MTIHDKADGLGHMTMNTPENGGATLQAVWLGRTDYRRCWELQRRLVQRRLAGGGGDLLLLTEHDPVFTVGATGSRAQILADAPELALRGIDVVDVDRGGAVTYHGPGQLVGYPLLDLHSYTLDLHRYLRDLEEVVIRVLRRYEVAGARDTRHTGVWVGNAKICAIGIRSVRWNVMHGFALNVAPDLAAFQRIIPCGITDKGVTSLERLGVRPAWGDLLAATAEDFGAVFQRTVTFVPTAEALDGLADDFHALTTSDRTA